MLSGKRVCKTHFDLRNWQSKHLQLRPQIAAC
jgi:hypothetical protein